MSIALGTITATAICPAVMPSLSSSGSASSAKVVPGVEDGVVEGALVDGAAGGSIAAGETTLIVKLFVFEARFDSLVSGAALRVTVIDDAVASSGTSPERMNVCGLYESHVVSGTIDIEMSFFAESTKLSATSYENGSPIVAFNGAISVFAKIPPDISMLIITAATSSNLSLALTVTLTDEASSGTVPERVKVEASNFSQPGASLVIAARSKRQTALPSSSSFPARSLKSI